MTRDLRIAAVVLLFVAAMPAARPCEIVATYLGNESVLVVHGESKILFDPLYRNDFGLYQLVPAPTKQAILAGAAPFDDVDAVFVSHYHGDHFAAEDMLALLHAQHEIRLYAPVQAVTAMRDLAANDVAIFDRVVGIDLAYGDPPTTIQQGQLMVSAVRIPHSGWPTTHTNVQNMAFRVTLDDTATVLHLGDADTRDEHYARDGTHWASRRIDMAFPPYWYFPSSKGRYVLTTRLKPRHSVGVHVPIDMPDRPAERPAQYRGYDLFTEPGQMRRIDVAPRSYGCRSTR